MTRGSGSRIQGCDSLPDALRGGVLAIGNFDGVHRGHQAVLETALTIAAEQSVPALVLTFEPHPRAVFRPDSPPQRITPAPMKARLVGLLGFDAIVEEPFDHQLAAMPAEDFVKTILVETFAACHVVTGFDFHFGKGRAGNPVFLADAGLRHGFGVTQVEPFCDENGEPVSSTRIRDMLAEGAVGEAAGQLGYRFTVEADVIHGRKLGRTLGYPTANMALPETMPLSHGIYAVRLRRPDGSLHDGVASFGRRPTVDDAGAPLLETYVFDFNGNLYGETCAVSIFGHLRGEAKFDGLEALVTQMHRDEAEARALLSNVRPLSELDGKVAF